MSDPVDDLIKALGTMTARTARQARELSEATAAAGGTIEHEWFTLTIGAGELSSLTFTEAGSDVSPVKLRAAILEAWREAKGRQLTGTSAALEAVLPGLGIGKALREAAAGGDITLPEPDEDEDSSTGATGMDTPEDLAAGEATLAAYRQAEEEGLALDPEAPLDLDDLFADEPQWLARQQDRDPFADPAADFTAAIEAAVARGRAKAASLQTATGEAESRWFRLSVDGYGDLRAVTVLPAARRRKPQELTSDFADVYARALAEARTGGETVDWSALFTD